MATRWRYSLRFLIAIMAIFAVLLAIGRRWRDYWEVERRVTADVVQNNGDVRFQSALGTKMDPDGALAARLPWGGPEGWKYLHEIQFAPGPDPAAFAISQLKSLHGLRHLSCMGPQITDADLTEISACKQLESLALYETDISAAGIDSLANCSALSRLTICGSGISPEMTRAVCQLRSLKGLRVDVEGRALAELLSVSRWEVLESLHVTVTDSSIPGEFTSRHFAQLEQLNIVNLQDDVTLAKVLNISTRLRSISLERCEIGIHSQRRISKLTEVRGLTVAGSELVDADLILLKGLDQLNSLSLQGNPITAEGVLEYAPRSIERIDLSGTEVGGEIGTFIRQSSKLRRLRLRGAKVTDTDLKSLRSQFPNVSIDD